MVDQAIRAVVEDLLARYVHAIDDDRLEEWPGFFAPDGRYLLTTAENHAAGLPLCIIQADSPAMMVDRIAALRHANIYEAQTYRHVQSSLLLRALDGERVAAVSNFQVVRTMHDGAAVPFASGRYVDRIRLPGGPCFEERLVLLDSRRVDTLLAIPI
ncbi:MAG: aromatic-ring-hydroxylating dioxygenase subunit beta [Burkholderiales bacterium]|nr:aromatic-ring-hydroxylating dioxygenase subunit beta [Burkholderiales bacterium]